MSLQTPSDSVDQQALDAIEREMHDLDDYLNTVWQSDIEVKTAAQSRQGGGYQNIGNVPELELIKEQVTASMEYYKDNIIDVRAQQHLPKILAHGTTYDALFHPSDRSKDRTQQGIVLDGMKKGDYAAFENYDGAGGQGGWWCSFYTNGPKPSRDVWILKTSRNNPFFTIVFPDPRTYQLYLKQMQQHVSEGKSVAPHAAMHLAKFLDHLYKTKGRMPNEVNR